MQREKSVSKWYRLFGVERKEKYVSVLKDEIRKENISFKFN